jgi:hypothetical protein|tara:strand:- start:583 stop:705 length:123 start_codon:yes stop_codon:yes gene_type:complete
MNDEQTESMVNALLIMQESLQNISATMDKLLVLAEGETEE